MATRAHSDPDTTSEQNDTLTDDLPLRRRVDELEREIARLQSRPESGDGPPPGAQVSIGSVFRKIGLLLVIALAAIPPGLVTWDRWFDRPLTSALLSDIWCRSEFLCQLSYPPYLLIAPLSLAVVVIAIGMWRNEHLVAFSNLSLGRALPELPSVPSWQMLASRLLHVAAGVIFIIILPLAVFRGRIPGWDLVLALLFYVGGWFLREVQTREVLRWISDRRDIILSLGLFHIALCSVLFTLFSNAGPAWLYFLLLALAAINMWPHLRRVPIPYWLMTISLVIFTWRLDAWQYMAIGDEYSFFYDVINFIRQESLIGIGEQLFNGQHVYGTHPYFSSLIHAVFMRLFDYRNFGWRFSNPYLSAVSLGMFYYFFKAFFPRGVTIAATLALGASHYLISFSKIGYNNLQALFAMGLVLALAAWALRSMRLLAFSMLGLGIGFCFYVYPAALYVVPLPFILLLLFIPPRDKGRLIRWGVVVLSAFLLVFPLISQSGYWAAKVPGTFYFNPELASSTSALLQHTFENIIYSLFSFLYVPLESHYVSTAYMDPLSGALIFLGMAFSVKLLLRRIRGISFLWLAFMSFLFFVGASHDRQFPTATRMFLFLPWFALFAALGWSWLYDVSSRVFRAGFEPSRYTALLVVTLFGLNLYQAYVVDYDRMQRYHDLGPLMLRTLRQIESRPEIPPKTTVFISDPSWNADGMNVLVDVYQTPPSRLHFNSIQITEPILSQENLQELSHDDKLVVLKPSLEQEWKSALGVQLTKIGKFPCEIKTVDGEIRFRLWHSGDLGWLCQN